MFRRNQAVVLCALLLGVVSSRVANGQLNQPIRDSLERVLSQPLSATERLHPLKEMAWSYLFSPAALPYLRELDSLTRVLAGDPDASVRRTALRYRSSMFYQLGYKAKFRRNMVAAQHDFHEATRTAREGQDTLAMANAMNALGVSYLALGMPEQALRYFEEELALVLSTANKSPMYISDIRQHKADALMRMGRFADARKELLQCDSSEIGRHALTLMGLGQLEAYQGDTAAALRLMARAQGIVEGTSQPWDRITVLEPMARMQLRAGRYRDALATADQAIALARALGDEAALAGCLVIAGDALLHGGDARAAERMFHEAMEIAGRNGYIGLSRETGDDGSMVRAAEELKDLYKTQGRTTEALAMTELWTAWKDTIHVIEGREELLRFDLQQAQLTDSIADAQRVVEATQGLQATLERERAQRRFALVAGAGLLLLLLLAGLFLLNRRKQERILAQHEKQRDEQERMIHELRMRELMSDDLHEELGAGLSALKLWSDMDLAEESDPRRRQLLATRSAMADELVASLRQIIWAMNSPSTTVKQLVDYLVDYAHLYCSQHGLILHAESTGDRPSITLHPEQRRNPFLALKESLVNTVKHGGADRVDLRITWENGLVIDIRDNGKGTSSDPDRLPGNGLRNMKRRIAAIGGEVRLDGSNGMRVVIRLPLTA